MSFLLVHAKLNLTELGAGSIVIGRDRQCFDVRSGPVS